LIAIISATFEDVSSSKEELDVREVIYWIITLESFFFNPVKPSDAATPKPKTLKPQAQLQLKPATDSKCSKVKLWWARQTWCRRFKNKLRTASKRALNLIKIRDTGHSYYYATLIEADEKKDQVGSGDEVGDLLGWSNSLVTSKLIRILVQLITFEERADGKPFAVDSKVNDVNNNGNSR